MPQHRYRKLALKYHPAKCTEPEAAAEFARVCEAYDVLSHRALRSFVLATFSSSSLGPCTCSDMHVHNSRLIQELGRTASGQQRSLS